VHSLNPVFISQVGGGVAPIITVLPLEFTKQETVLTLLNVYTPKCEIVGFFWPIKILVALKLFKILNFGYWRNKSNVICHIFILH
jgi:hypothetical protein